MKIRRARLRPARSQFHVPRAARQLSSRESFLARRFASMPTGAPLCSTRVLMRPGLQVRTRCCATHHHAITGDGTHRRREVAKGPDTACDANAAGTTTFEMGQGQGRSRLRHEPARCQTPAGERNHLRALRCRTLRCGYACSFTHPPSRSRTSPTSSAMPTSRLCTRLPALVERFSAVWRPATARHFGADAGTPEPAVLKCN